MLDIRSDSRIQISRNRTNTYLLTTKWTAYIPTLFPGCNLTSRPVICICITCVCTVLTGQRRHKFQDDLTDDHLAAYSDSLGHMLVGHVDMETPFERHDCGSLRVCTFSLSANLYEIIATDCPSRSLLILTSSLLPDRMWMFPLTLQRGFLKPRANRAQWLPTLARLNNCLRSNLMTLDDVYGWFQLLKNEFFLQTGISRGFLVHRLR